ncbi:MAG: transcription elongation factor GreA [Planctomycetota bacterium]
MGDAIPITVKGKEIIEQRLADLEAKGPALRKALELAREKGDLSENAEFHAARESIGQLEGQINELNDKLRRSQIVDPSRAPRDRVAFGAIVTIVDLENEKEEIWQLVGLGEDDPAEKRILTTSPLGQGLMLKKKGEEAEFDLPRGKVRYRVQDIRYPS